MASLAKFSVKTTQFFDRPHVLKKLDAFERLWLGRIGAFTRRTARSSIRRRKAVSKPGSPPTSRTGILKNSILFGLASGGKSVVIGPSANFFKGSRNAGASALEHGGRIETPKYKRVTTGGRWVTINGKRRTIGGKVTRKKVGFTVANYRARPYMGPALPKAMAALAKKYPTDLPRMFAIAAAGGR